MKVRIKVIKQINIEGLRMSTCPLLNIGMVFIGKI